MTKLNLVIADTDELYLNHLTNYLSENVKTFEVFSFTTESSLIKFINENANKIDVIVFAEDFLNEAVGTANIPAKILLSDGSAVKNNGFEIINKYQKAEKFINDILMVYAEKTGRTEVVSRGNKDTRIIGFYSPVGGSGKTTLAVAAAVALSAQGKKVFYLNLERINSVSEVMNEANNGNMSDVYLAVKTKGANIGLKVMANKHTDIRTGVSYINPAESSLEINELNVDEIKKLIKEIDGLREFDVIIADFDGELDRDKISVLECIDKIFVPFTADGLSLYKMKAFIKEINMYDELKELADKACFVLNKSTVQSGNIVGESGILNSAEVKANIALSPIFSDIKNIFHAGEAVASVVSGIIGDI